MNNPGLRSIRFFFELVRWQRGDIKRRWGVEHWRDYKYVVGDRGKILDRIRWIDETGNVIEQEKGA